MAARTLGGKEKIVTVIEVALRDGKWEYRDLNLTLPDPQNSAEYATESPDTPGPPKRVVPLASTRTTVWRR